MFDFLLNLFDTSDFPSRWNCGTWSTGHGWLHILSDLATWAAYTTIPFVLTYFAWRRKDIPFTRLFWLFAIFILACGSVHLVEAAIFWIPVYRVSGLLKLATAVASWMTVLALIQIAPRAFNLPSLAATNARLHEEIQQRSIVERALRDSELRARLILESTGEAIYGLDLNGVCTFCNPACVRILGYNQIDELIGKNMHQLVHHTRVDGSPYANEECRIYTALRTNEPVHVEDEVLWKKDGTSFPAEYWSHPIQNDGRTVGAVVTFIDITQRMRAKEELIRARHAAEEANRAKSQFLANTSHEIRTPLTAILGYAEILLPQCEGQNRQHVSKIQQNGETLLELIDDILDLSRIEAGRFEKEASEVHTGALVQHVLNLMRFRADDKSLDLAAVVDGEVPATIWTDEKRLRQILVNLLANAIKFTEQGRVELRVQSQRAAEPPSVQFLVRDTGIGITEEQKARLFQPFEQGDPSVNRKYGGSGLGLAISRRLVNALDGELTVQSEAGVGSEFCVTLPIGMAAPTFVSDLEWRVDGDRPSPSGDAPHEVNLKCRVLLADDRRDVRHIAQHFLTSAGATVVTAEDGAQALAEVDRADADGQPFDVVVMDMQMPTVDGYSAVAQLRARGQQMPIIALTADAMQGDREKALDAGCDDYLSKPIDSQKLVATVGRVLTVAREDLRSARRERSSD